jgi:hypothetical protein
MAMPWKTEEEKPSLDAFDFEEEGKKGCAANQAGGVANQVASLREMIAKESEDPGRKRFLEEHPQLASVAKHPQQLASNGQQQPSSQKHYAMWWWVRRKEAVMFFRV